MATSVDLLVSFAKMAQQDEDYYVMVAAMKAAVEKNMPLSGEERRLFGVAYKNLVMHIIARLKVASSLDQNIMKSYKTSLQLELHRTYYEVLTLLVKYLLPKAVHPEHKVFYMKMRADYCQLWALIVTGDLRAQMVAASEDAYKEASKIARAHLGAEHLLTVMVAHNLSLLYYHLLDSPNRAFQVLNQAVDEAIAVLWPEVLRSVNNTLHTTV